MEQEQSRSRPPISRKTAIIVGVAGLIIIGFGVYFFGLRVQDSDYDAATKQVTIMLDNAAAIKALGGQGYLNPETVTDDRLASDQKLVDAYTSARAALEQSRAATADSNVAAYLKNVKTKLTKYGQSSSDMIATVKGFASIKQNCNNLLGSLQSVTSSSELTAAEANCKTALASYPTVPLDDFNKNYFQAYHKDVSDLLTALETYYTAGDLGAAGLQKSAQASINTAMNAVTTLNKSNDYPITNTANPTDELTKLKSLLSQRRSVIFR